MMIDQNGASFPDSPVEMASWVRDRSMKVIEELTEIISVVKDDLETGDELQSTLHFPVSAALANAIRLAAFASGKRISGDELSAMMGSIYRDGQLGFDGLIRRFDSQDSPEGLLEEH